MTLLILLEAGVGIEPAYTDLQSAAVIPRKPSIHAGLQPMRLFIHF